MLGIIDDSYDAFVWVTAQFSRPMNNWWLNCKQLAAIPDSFDSLIEELRKTSWLPNIRDDAINALFGITQGDMNYAYTKLFDDFLRRSRQPRTNDLQRVRFISGLANFQLQTQAKSHRSHKRDYN
jgi:hypothetical protein